MCSQILLFRNAVLSDGKWKLEIDHRVQAGRAALIGVSKHAIWNKNISIQVKKVVFEAMVKSKLMYGSQVWWANQSEIARMETIQNDFLRWVCGYIRNDRMHTEELRLQVGGP